MNPSYQTKNLQYEDLFRTKSAEKYNLLQDFDSLEEIEKAERIAAIWQIDQILETLIGKVVELGIDPIEEMKSWLPFKGLSPYEEWKKLTKSGQEITAGKLLKLADEMEEKQLPIEGLTTKAFGDEN